MYPLQLADLMTFERLEALLGWNNSLISASTYYSQNYSGIIGTALGEVDVLSILIMNIGGVRKQSEQ